jgi:putative flavoprotein involved in K+ transport
MATTTSVLDVLVIGAGQAGLALGYQLKQTGQAFMLVDKYDRIGESWRRRFDSLTLFTPRSYSALPGLSVAGDPDGYPTKDEIADYLKTYARHFDLPVALGTEITRLEQTGDLFRATTSAGTVLTARSVVLATGAFQQPAIPVFGARFATNVVQLTPETYRNPRQTPSGTVLVVGDGATGRQIARELSTTHLVYLSTGRPRKVSPHRVLGKSVFWWMDKLGILTMSPNSRIGRKLKETDPFPGKDLALDKLRRGGVSVVGRLSEVDGQRVSFADGQSAEIDAVIWATGYRDESDWVVIPEIKDARGGFGHDQGLSPIPGLAFIGRSWQRSRGSALLTGVGEDAAFVVDQLLRAPESRVNPAWLPDVVAASAGT